MNQPNTAREALIAETLGEVAALVERVEALAPANGRLASGARAGQRATVGSEADEKDQDKAQPHAAWSVITAPELHQWL